MHEIGWAGQETTEVKGLALWNAHSSGWDQGDLNPQAWALALVLNFANPMWMFPIEVNGSLVTDETDFDNVPPFASNDAGGDRPEHKMSFLFKAEVFDGDVHRWPE